MFKLSSLYAMLASALGAQIAPRGRVNPFARSGRPPENPRYWHAGKADPIQAARIEAAGVKRARRAEKLQLRTRTIKNMTHRNCANASNLNPFYVAK